MTNEKKKETDDKPPVVIPETETSLSKITDIDKYTPKGIKVLEDPNDPEIKRKLELVKTEEVMMKLLQNFREGRTDIDPLIIYPDEVLGMKARVCERDGEGNIILPSDIKTVTAAEIKAREQVAEDIVSQINPILKDQISSVAYVALVGKPLNLLKKIRSKLITADNNNRKPKVNIANRIGCVFLEIDDETVQI